MSLPQFVPHRFLPGPCRARGLAYISAMCYNRNYEPAYMLISEAADMRPNSAANPLPTPINSAAGRLAKIVSKLLILLYSWVLEGRFSGVKTRFVPHSRDMRWGPRRTGSRRGLLRGDAAVDDESGPGHEAGIVRDEKDDALGDVG